MKNIINLLTNKITVPQGYHDFVDKRSFLEIPNFLDVISNLAILLPVLYLLQTRKKKSLLSNLLILHISLLAITSGYYHLNPSDKTVFWDIMSIATGSMIVLLIIINTTTEYNLLLYIFAVFSIIYWKYTGDLRLYLLIYIGVPFYIIAKYYKNNNLRVYLFIMIFCNILVWLTEFNDHYIYKITNNLVSGHTLKHIFAGIGIFYVIKILQKDNKL
tara:strand:- start:1775 stop:2422 length:648 start_codon:yes stop_codon:yes gene_type:complete